MAKNVSKYKTNSSRALQLSGVKTLIDDRVILRLIDLHGGLR